MISNLAARKYQMHNYKLKLALIGYGKMGKVIERLAIERGHDVILRISSNNLEEFNEDQLTEADVAIEFSTPDHALANLEKLAAWGTRTVCGTTGWLASYNSICTAFKQSDAAFLYASNFSIGVNIFFALNEKLASLMNGHNNYQVRLHESHHTTKKDAPSGTAVTLAEQIIDHNEEITSWILNPKCTDDQIPITYSREGDVKGMHEISYTSDIDQLVIRHEAFSREGFALGALHAAEYIAQKNGIFTMKEVLGL